MSRDGPCLYGRGLLFRPDAFPRGGERSGDDKRLLSDGMDEGDLPSVQADAAVGIAAGCAVFEVAFDGAADMGELAANLVVPSGQ